MEEEEEEENDGEDDGNDEGTAVRAVSAVEGAAEAAGAIFASVPADYLLDVNDRSNGEVRAAVKALAAAADMLVGEGVPGAARAAKAARVVGLAAAATLGDE